MKNKELDETARQWAETERGKMKLSREVWKRPVKIGNERGGLQPDHLLSILAVGFAYGTILASNENIEENDLDRQMEEAKDRLKSVFGIWSS